MNQKNIYIFIISFLTLLVITTGVWFFFFRSSPTAAPTTTGSFGAASNNVTGGANNSTPGNGIQTIVTDSGQTAQQKIFQITAGPVVGATLLQTLHPTTTIARYIRQDDGHVFDLPLDVPGAVPRVVSNVTIPGGARALWVEGGNAVMQYLDASTVKTIYLGFPTSTSTDASVTLPTRIRFLPDAIVDMAVSPDGMSVTYMLKTSTGADGYTAKPDGTGSKKIFSLPFSQLLVSWPATTMLLVQTKPAAGVPGALFSVDVKSGIVTPLVYATGLSAIADKTFLHVLYQTDESGVLKSYSHDVKTGADAAVVFSLTPEKCAWGTLVVATLYCAAPYTITTQSAFVDSWRAGTVSIPNFIYSFSQTTNRSSLVAAPGTSDGGVQSDILELAASPDGRYLSFTTKGPRAVWGVRLGSQ